jgi:metacaspase-1
LKTTAWLYPVYRRQKGNLIMKKLTALVLLCCFISSLYLTNSPQTVCAIERRNSHETIQNTVGAQRTARKRALLIGVWDYQRANREGNLVNLSSETDVSALREVLISKFNFTAADIRVLRTREETTGQAIRNAVQSFLIEPTQAGDIVYLHYSGHGGQATDDNGDEADGLDETIIPSDYVSNRDTSRDIRDDVFGQWLAAIKRKQPANFTVTFDSCHSGDVSRGGAAVSRGGRTGWRPPPAAVRSRAGDQLGEAGGGFLSRGEAEGSFVFLSAASSYQKSWEAPYTDNAGQRLGLFTYSLINALTAATDQTTYASLYERLADEVARQIRTANLPAQTPQIEGDRSNILLSGTAVPTPPYYMVRAGGQGITIQAGQLHGLTVGSRFAIYPAETVNFQTTQPLAEAELTELRLTEAVLSLPTGARERVGVERLRAARAVERERAPNVTDLTVDAREIASLPRGQEILARLRSLPLVNVTPQDPNAATIRLRRATTDANTSSTGTTGTGSQTFVAERTGDSSVLILARDADELLRTLPQALQREAVWRYISSLQNTAANINLDMRLVRVNYNPATPGVAPSPVTGDAYVTEGGQLAVGDFVQIELRNASSFPVYVTIFDLQNNRAVGALWPNSQQGQGNNQVRNSSEWIRLPTIFRIEEPLGLETFRAIATLEATDFSPLINRTRSPNQLNAGSRNALRSPLGRMLDAISAGTRSTAVGSDPSQWATAEINFTVIPRRTTAPTTPSR